MHSIWERERERETNSRARLHQREINFGRVEPRLARYRKTTNAMMFNKFFLFFSNCLASLIRTIRTLLARSVPPRNDEAMLLFGRALITLCFATPFKNTTRRYRVTSNIYPARCLCFCEVKSERERDCERGRKGEIVFVDGNSLFYGTTLSTRAKHSTR